ncbi:hypothetical protein TIFTF001_035345 [Ficus carica]|uniref:Uncharacterized protein n=1 Tax=Ficus carica TaxID=3494 RepID=A0AA88J9Z0_FICCA|nr:hypothetical protein TIFTF001_035316 [Ficus carica]GMN66252.1 hypothetical protein TIFTF001_035321 [Ficus carica]GMN66275.1 hypothetical protein TIFTF001_035340 [Ficus carica]GMN66276.1 hypothetical protein TIFTF001_035345 [Ficus carica]
MGSGEAESDPFFLWMLPWNAKFSSNKAYHRNSDQFLKGGDEPRQSNAIEGQRATTPDDVESDHKHGD